MISYLAETLIRLRVLDKKERCNELEIEIGE